MSVVDLVRIERCRVGDRRHVTALRQRTVEAVVILGLLEHDELEGLARTEALFLEASIRNDLENARVALTRLAALHAAGAAADLMTLSVSEGSQTSTLKTHKQQCATEDTPARSDFLTVTRGEAE